MILKILFSIFLQMIIAESAPLQLPLLNQLDGLTQQQIPMLQALQTMMQQQIPSQEMMQPSMALLKPLKGTVKQQRLALQEQMFALQQFQALQRMNLVPSPMSMNAPPILVLFPNTEPDVRRTDFNTNSLKYQNPEEIGDYDSEIIDAEPTEESSEKSNSMRAVLLIPHTRSIIGGLISSIPFLPIEINVPDSISWIYNGIAGIISVIGQSLPFRPQTPNGEAPNEGSVKLIWDRIKKQEMPIVIPLG